MKERKNMSLLKSQRVFKPMKYPEAFEHWSVHDKMVWHWDEVPLSDDVQDFAVADEEEKDFITQVMRLFTQNDVEVGHGYDVLLRIFKPTEVSMMLRGNADRENTHIAAYSLFTETLGFPDEFYSEYLDDTQMKDKVDFVVGSQVKKYEEYDEFSERQYIQDIMFMLAVYATLTEGVSLFAQFAMLLKYQLEGKYKGLGTIVEWSIKDEEQHVVSNSWLFRTFVKENQEYFDDVIKKRIYQATRDLVQKECELVDTLNPPHMNNEEVKEYIKYIADQRLKLIGFKPNYEMDKSPFPWMDELTGTVLTNFFEGKATEYTMNSLTGSWEELKKDTM
jgi:ribonucleoside-diphosphate reductase beta chain